MLLQITGGGGTPPPEWYDRGLFWGYVGVFLCFGALGCGAAMSNRIVWAHVFFAAAWPWGLLAAWLALNGVTKNRKVRIGGRITAAVLIGVLAWLVDRAMTKESSPQVTEKLPGFSASPKVKTSKTIPVPTGPQVIPDYNSKTGQVMLANEGPEVAMNVQVEDVVSGEWTIRFAPIPALKKDHPVILKPTELVERSAPEQYIKPYANKEDPDFALFLRKISTDKRITQDPVEIQVIADYRHASDYRDDLHSVSTLHYDRRTKSVRVEFNNSGKMVPK